MRPINVNVLMDALLIATLSGSVILAATLIAGRRSIRSIRSIRSGQLQHQIHVHAIVSSALILALVVLFRPDPVGCIARRCGQDKARADHAAQVQQQFTALAAEKFSRFSDFSAPMSPGSSTPESIRSDDGAAAGDGPLRIAATLLDGAGSGAILTGLWLMGVAAFLVRIRRRRRLARRMVREAGPVEYAEIRHRFAILAARAGIRKPLRLREHPDLAVPVVTGAIRPVVLLPTGIQSRAEAEMIFLHELGHIRRGDLLLTLICEIGASLFWFNPLVWLALRRMIDLQEMAADSHVLRDGILPSNYARFLLDTFRALSSTGGAALPFSHSIVGNCLVDLRVRRILDPDSLHREPSRSATFGLVIGAGLLCLAFSFAPSGLKAQGFLTRSASGETDINRSLLNAASLDSLVRPVFIDHMADRYIAGAAISVVHEGRIIYRGGFGRREIFREVPVDPDRTIWRIGSITKVLTAVTVMQLVDEGVLALDADVNDYLTEFKVPDTYDEPVRVRNLLTHTSGFDQIGLGRHVSSREEVRPLGGFLKENLVRIRPPNEVSTYDTYGITLAGYLVERLSGLSYEEYLTQHVFQPLSMFRSGIVVPPALQDDVAVGYGFAGHWEAEPWEFMNTDPASTVNATVADMANFAIMLLEGGRFDGRQVLTERSVRAMLTQQWTNDPQQPGYGLTLWEDRSYGIPAFSHGGSMAGFSALLYLVPGHRLGVFIVNNQETGSLQSVVLSALMDSLFPDRPETPVLRPRWGADDDLSRFTGTYANSLYHHGDRETGWRRRPFDLTATEDGGLLFQGEPAHRVGPLAFQRQDGLLLTFREDERGRITFLFVNQGVYERLR